MKHRHNDYSDIIALPHYELRFHTRMPMEARAAQFAAFAALTGYDAVIQETARLTQGPVFLTEESQEALNRELNAIAENLSRQPRVILTIYQEDGRKEGGAFQEIEGNVKKLDLYEGGLILTDGREVPFFRIVGIRQAE